MQSTKRHRHTVYTTEHTEQKNNTGSKLTGDMTDRQAIYIPGKKSKAMKETNKRTKTYMNKKQRRIDRQRRQQAFKIQKRFDDDRQGKQPQEVEENRFVIDHICYTTASHACVKWCGYKQPTMEPLFNLFEDAQEEVCMYIQKGLISKKEYLTYLKVRDQQKAKKKLQRKSDDSEGNSSEVHTSEIESDNNDNENKRIMIDDAESTTEVEGSEEDLE